MFVDIKQTLFTDADESFSLSNSGSFILPFWFLFWSFLFNLYINDLLFLAENTNVFNYASDTTFYACDLDLLEPVA